MAYRSSWISGSPYIQDSAAAREIASMTIGEGPKTFSLAPMRAVNGRPRPRSCVSGPTNGTVAGKLRTNGVML